MAKGESRYETYGSRWGPGKVHQYLYDPVNRLWYVSCRGPERGDPHGRRVDDRTGVTCRKCQPAPAAAGLEDRL